MTLDKSYLVEKSRILNKMHEGYNTLQETRLFLAYISRIDPRANISDPTKPDYQPQGATIKFTLNEFKELMEYKGKDLEYFKATAKKIMGKTVFLESLDGGFRGFVLFQDCELSLENGDWYFTMTAGNKAYQYFFDFHKNYFTYKLEQVLKLKSVNQIRMYEILKEYSDWKEKDGSPKEVKINLDELRSRLFIQQSEYLEYRAFRQKVIEPCRKAIEKRTDIKFTYRAVRSGRGGKTSALLFQILPNIKPKAEQVVSITDDVYDVSDVRNISIAERDAYCYANEDLGDLASSCEFQFDNEQMEVLNILLEEATDYNSLADDKEHARYITLKIAYNEALIRKKNGEVKTTLFHYIKGILEKKKSELQIKASRDSQ
jgi:plasmid replication initiation protein